MLRVLLALLVAGAFAEKEDGVEVLTKDNFNQIVTDHSIVLVEFFAPWCGHCKSLKPEYSQLASLVLAADLGVTVAMVDATVETEIAQKYSVKGFPTIILMKQGTTIEYRGSRKADDMLAWIKKKIGDAVAVIASSEEFSSLTENNDVVVAGAFKDVSTPGYAAYVSVASEIEDALFVAVHNEEVMASLQLADNSVIVYRKMDQQHDVYSGELTAEKIKEFVQPALLPLVIEFSDETAGKIFSGYINSHLMLFVSKTAESFEAVISEFKKAALNFKGRVIFVLVDVDVPDNERVLEFFVLKKDSVPIYRFIKVEEDVIKFNPVDNTLTASAFTQFTEDVLEGKIRRHLASEEVPEDWDANPVKVLVSSTFKEVVLDSGKRWLVEFYAPWCGHCKSLAPIWEELGQKYKDHLEIRIGKMDATANELEEVKISGFPTIKYFRAGEVMDYNLRGRTLDDFVNFLEADGQVSAETEPVEEAEEEPLPLDEESEEPGELPEHEEL